MACTFCYGKPDDGKTGFPARAEERVFVINDVPVYVCELCREAYYTQEIS
ncbi:YgiT-type zinc finger protein [Methanoregula sp.]